MRAPRVIATVMSLVVLALVSKASLGATLTVMPLTETFEPSPATVQELVVARFSIAFDDPPTNTEEIDCGLISQTHSVTFGDQDDLGRLTKVVVTTQDGGVITFVKPGSQGGLTLAVTSKYQWTVSGGRGSPLVVGFDATGDFGTTGQKLIRLASTVTPEKCPPASGEGEMPGDIVTVDLDVNTHNKPKDSNGIPVVSSPGDIDANDEPRETSPGGYIWVNDDNDNDAGDEDSTIDSQDVGYGGENDLEPLVYRLDGYRDGMEIELRAPASATGPIRLWQERTKTNELSAGSGGAVRVTRLADLDSDMDGLLFVEGLEPSLLNQIELLVVDGSRTVDSDEVCVTVFAPDGLKWADNPKNGTKISAFEERPPDEQRRTGLCIFPDRVSKNDKTIRDMPQLEATVAPAFQSATDWEIPLYCRVFDVDHYHKNSEFDTSLASEDRTEGHAPGYEPNDNRTGFSRGHPPVEGPLIGALQDRYDIGIKVVKVSNGDVLSVLANGENQSPVVRWGGRARVAPRAGKPHFSVSLKLTHHTPCNNWRVAAGCGDTMHRAIRISRHAREGQQLIFINGRTLATDSGQVSHTRSSQTLTVCRRLYVELTFMAPVRLDEGPEQSRSVRGPGRILRRIGTNTIETDLAVPYSNQFQNGVADFWADGYLSDTKVAAGRRLVGSSRLRGRFQLVDPVPASAHYGFFADDDVQDFETGGVLWVVITKSTPRVVPTFADTSFLWDRESLPAVCIFAGMSPDVGVRATTFDLNADRVGQMAAVLRDKKVRSQELFWAITVVSAYQAEVYESSDPDAQRLADKSDAESRDMSNSALLGIAFSPAAPAIERHPHVIGSAIIFEETIRDVRSNFVGIPSVTAVDARRHVVAHEVGHVLGGRHEDGGVMTGLEQEGHGFRSFTDPYSARSLLRFMLLKDKGPVKETTPAP